MQVEWLILADSAQMNGGKLYLLGGGWDTLNHNGPFPVDRHFGLAASFRVPWNETNMRHNASISIETEDGQEMANIQTQLEVGRAPGIPAGSDQRAQVAAEMMMRFEKPGVYSIVAKIEGAEAARTSF